MRLGVAGLKRSIATMATTANATASTARMVVSDAVTDTSPDNMDDNTDTDTMTPPMVPPPPPPILGAATGDSPRVLRIALPMLTVSWLVLALVLAASFVRISRWEIAPGEALTVSNRITVEGTKGAAAPERFANPSGIRFVTAFGGQLSALDAVLGWIDPWVQVDTFEEHFGTLTPDDRRRLGFQAMVGSKQIAEYVAATTLGLKASLVQGKVVVEQVVCDDAPETNAACDILELGDTITAIDAVPTPTLTELAEQIQGRAPGETITVTVVPAGQDDQSRTVDRTVTLMEDPDTPGRPIIGIVPADTRTVDLPFSVAISTSDIGGPSAGLAFTLAILDELTEGNLTGRGKVAATGTINEDGTVGAIGAVVQKAVAVRDVGVSLFLVPASQSEDELAEARRAAGSKVRIVPVATLAEALTALAENGGDPLPPRS